MAQDIPDRVCNQLLSSKNRRNQYLRSRRHQKKKTEQDQPVFGWDSEHFQPSQERPTPIDSPFIFLRWGGWNGKQSCYIYCHCSNRRGRCGLLEERLAQLEVLLQARAKLQNYFYLQPEHEEQRGSKNHQQLYNQLERISTRLADLLWRPHQLNPFNP